MNRKSILLCLLLSILTLFVGCGQQKTSDSSNPTYSEDDFGEDEYKHLDAVCRKDMYTSAYILYDKLCDTLADDLNEATDIVIPKNYEKITKPINSNRNITDIECRNYIVNNMDKCSHNNENSPYTVTVERMYRGRITTVKGSNKFFINGVAFAPELMGLTSDRTPEDKKTLKKTYTIAFLTNKDLENYEKRNVPINTREMSTATENQNFWGQVYVSYICNKHIDKLRVYVTDYTDRKQKYSMSYKPYNMNKSKDLNFNFNKNQMSIETPTKVNLVGKDTLQFIWSNNDITDTNNSFLYSNFKWKLDSSMRNQYVKWGGLATIFSSVCDSSDIELAIMYPPIALRQDYYIKGAKKPLVSTTEVLAPNVFKLGSPVYIKHLISSKLTDTFYCEQ